MEMKKMIIGMVVLLLAAVFVACAVAQPADVLVSEAAQTAAPKEEKTDEVLPSSGTEMKSNSVFGTFTVKDLAGNEATQEIFSEKDLTMVNVWATYCGPCLQEMPDLEALSQDYADKGFQIVGMPVDVQDGNGGIIDSQVELVKEIVEKTGVTYLNLIPEGMLVSAPSVPTTVFLDRNGNQVGEIYVGARSRSQWEEVINQMLDALPKEEASADSAEASLSIEENMPTAANLVNMPLFETFETTDINGTRVTEDILGGDPSPEATLALVWDPAWKGSEQALLDMQAYLEEHEEMAAVGFVMNAEKQQSAVAQLVEKTGATFPQLLPVNDLQNYISGREAQVFVIAPWGKTGGEPFLAALDLNEWSAKVDDALYNLYVGCCG